MSESIKHYRMISLSTPFPGREQALERWYDEQHIPDVLKLAGFVAAQRFRIDEPPGGIATPAWKVMVIFEIESRDLAATLQQIPQVVRTAAMPITDALDMSTALRIVAQEDAPRVVKAH